MGFDSRTVTLRDNRRVLLRAAEASDAQRCEAFMARLRATTPYVVTAPDEAKPLEKLREELVTMSERPGALILIAEPADQPDLVVADCWLVPFKERKMAHVASIGMGCDERWRGCGLGTAMLAAIIAHAEAHPALRRLELGVMPENTHARTLYRGLGFAEHGLRPQRFRQDHDRYSDEVIMGRAVKP